MAVTKINRRDLAALAEVHEPVTLNDDTVRGLSLRARPASSRNPMGSRNWFVEYRRRDAGRNAAKQRLRIGDAATMSPDEARRAARDILAAVRQGKDPAEERREGRAARSIVELEPIYTAKHQKRGEGTKAQYAGYWRNHLLPEIGKLRPRDLTKHRVETLIAEIANRYPVTSNRVHTLLRHFLKWARENGHAPAGIDVTAGVERQKERHRERFLNLDEYQRLHTAITQAETVGVPWATDSKSKHLPTNPENRLTRIDHGAADAIRLLAYTGCRLREVLSLEWSEFDRDRRMLYLRQTKTGESTRWLSPEAAEILERLWIAATVADDGTTHPPATPLVFPQITDATKVRPDLKAPWRTVTRAAGLEGLRLHDLRHSFASSALAQGVTLPVMGRLLGHRSIATTQKYAHMWDDAARAAAARVTQGMR